MTIMPPTVIRNTLDINMYSFCVIKSWALDFQILELILVVRCYSIYDGTIVWPCDYNPIYLHVCAIICLNFVLKKLISLQY